MDASKRSACDRCRGQKLRCVRLTASGRAMAWNDEPLKPCERCLKAGAECISSHPPTRKVMRTERPQAPPLVPLNSPSGRRLFQSGFPSNANISQYGNGIDDDIEISSGGKNQYGSAKKAGAMPMSQPRPSSRKQFDDSHTRWKQGEMGPDRSNINLFGQAQFGGQNSPPHAQNSSGDSTSTGNPLSIDRSEALTFITDKSTLCKSDDAFIIEDFDFSVGLNTDFGTHDNEPTGMIPEVFVPNQKVDVAPMRTLGSEKTLSCTEKPEAGVNKAKEDCLHRLTELNSRLSKDFSRTNSMKTSDISSFSMCCDSRLSDCSNGPSKPSCTKHAIGRALENSQTFLNILQCFHPNPPSSTESECSYSEHWDENEFAMVNNDQPHVTCNALAPVNGENSSSNSGGNQPTASDSSPATMADMPMTLIILACYTYLLQTYEAVFSIICSWLSSRDESAFQRSFPAVLPGFRIGSFDLDNHRDLQLEVLVWVSSKMLDRVEETLGIGDSLNHPLYSNQDNAPRGAGRVGILDSMSASALLDIVSKQRNLGPQQSAKGANRTAVSVRKIMDSIQELLRSGV